MDNPDFLVLVIHRAVRHLKKFIREGCGIGSIDISVLQRDDQVGFKLVIQLPLGAILYHIGNQGELLVQKLYGCFAQLYLLADIACFFFDHVIVAGQSCERSELCCTVIQTHVGPGR